MPTKCSFCGDGKRISGTAELCDEGPGDPNGPTNGCLSTCLGIVSGWYCVGGSNTTADVCSTCGDGKRLSGTPEVCDEGPGDPNGPTSGCLNTCLGIAPGWFCAGGSSTTADVCSTCGDGFRVSGTTEICDEGPSDPTGPAFGCSADCLSI